MIWFRRIIAVPLALVFILLFISLLVIHRVNATAGNPDFYAGQLEQADVYNYIYHDVLPAALDEVESDIGSDDFPVEFALLKSRAPAVLEQVLPSDWLQMQVEQVSSQILSYALGDTEHLSMSIPLKDRVEAAAVAFKDLLHDQEFFDELYGQGVEFALEKYAEMQADLPSFLTLSEEEAASVIRDVLPPGWIITQSETAIDEVIPYFAGEKDSFLVKLDILARMDALEDAIADILMKPAAHDFVLNDLIVPYIKENTADVMELIPQLTFTDSEIIAVLEEVLPPDWYEARVTDIVGQVFSYLKGITATVNIVVPLAELKPATAEVLTDLADIKLENLYDSLPVATPEQIAELLANPPMGVLPPYRPPDISYAQIKALVGIDIAGLTASSVVAWMPDRFVINDADIRDSLSEDGDEDLLTQVRDMVRDGVTYTDADLREDLGEDFAIIEDVRDWIASGFTVTETDLQEWLAKEEGADPGETWQALEDIRSVAGTVRDWIWPAWLVPALLLVGIGFLGGRGWKSRVAWGAAVLAIACLITYIVFGPVFSAFAEPRIEEAFNESLGQTDGVGALVADKGITIAKNTVDSFVGGINIQAIVLFVLSLVVIAVVVWHPWNRRTEMTSGQITPEDVPPPLLSPPDLLPHNLPPTGQRSSPRDDLPPADYPPDSPDRPTG